MPFAKKSKRMTDTPYILYRPARRKEQSKRPIVYRMYYSPKTSN